MAPRSMLVKKRTGASARSRVHSLRTGSLRSSGALNVPTTDGAGTSRGRFVALIVFLVFFVLMLTSW